MSTARMNTETRAIPATIQIGKKGLTDELLREIQRQLKQRKTIKIRLLRTALQAETKDNLIRSIQSHTSAELMSQIGNAIVIRK